MPARRPDYRGLLKHHVPTSGAAATESPKRYGGAVRWGLHLLTAYVGGLLIGAPIGLALYGMTHVSYFLTGAIVASMLSVLLWRLRTQ